MKNRLTIISLLWILLVLPGKAQETDVKKLLPDPSGLEQWDFSREPECYRGEELFDLINGGADLFYEYSFVKVVNAQYAEKGGSKIQVEIYQMDSDSSAYGIFSSIYSNTAIKKEYGLYSLVDEQYIAFVKDRYYVNIAWLIRSNARQESLEALARMVNEKITAEGRVPRLLISLEGVERDGIPVYFRGNIALSNVYYFDYKDHFQIKQGAAFKSPGMLKLVFVYDDVETPKKVFSSVQEFLQGSRRFDDVGMIYQGFTCSDNKGNRLAFRSGNRFISVVVAYDEAVQLVSAQEKFFNQVEEALNNP